MTCTRTIKAEITENFIIMIVETWEYNMIKASVVTNKGLVRLNNEDNYFFDGEVLPELSKNKFSTDKTTFKTCVFAIFDGMGGENAGEVAAQLAVNQLLPYYEKMKSEKSDVTNTIKLFQKYIEETNNYIYEKAVEDIETGGMGTTCVSLFIIDKQAICLNLGDSRAYLLRDNTLHQISEDHTEGERLIKIGALSRAEVRKHKSRNILTRHLGVSPEEGKMEATFSEIFNLKKGDTFLLCSDGLTDMLPDETIKSILSTCFDVTDQTQMLVSKALEKGGKDNITVNIIQYDEDIK